MNWKKEAAERLKKYEILYHANHKLPMEIKRLEAEALSTTRAMAEDKDEDRENRLLNNIVMRREIQWAWERSKIWLEVTESALACLGPEDQLILHRLYISQEKDGMERLCQELGLEQSSVYRRRDRALENFTRALYGTINIPPQKAS